MTQTNLKTKVITVESSKNTNENQQVTSNIKNQEIPSNQKSSFTRAEPNQWKAMSDSIVHEMVNAMDGIEQGSPYSGPIDELLNSMIIVDPVADRKAGTTHEIPEVPDFYKLMSVNPMALQDIDPYLERFELIERTIVELKENTLKSLKRDTNPSESRNLQKYMRGLNNAHIEVKKQLEHVRYFKHLQELRIRERFESDES